MRRRSTLHKGAVGIFGMVGVMLAAASFAWACSSSPAVVFRGAQGGQGSPSTSSGPAGSSVTLDGRDWADGTVVVHWNTSTGGELASPTAKNGSFSVAVTIPPTAQPGVYTIYLTQNQLVARASFEVTPSDSSTGGSTPGGTPTGQTSTATNGGDNPQSTTGGPTARTTNGGTNGDGSVVPNQGGTQSFATPGNSEAVASEPTRSESATTGPVSSEPARSEPARSEPATTGPASSTAAQRPAAATPSDGAITTPAGHTVFSGSLAPSAPAPATSTGPVGTTADQAAKIPDVRTVSGDLYSGFKASNDASLMPGLADSARTSSGPASQAVLGMVLFAASLTALFGGFYVAEARRRRVLSRAS